VILNGIIRPPLPANQTGDDVDHAALGN